MTDLHKVLNVNSFQPTGEPDRVRTMKDGTELRWVQGTMELTLGRETRRVPAEMIDGTLIARGIVGRYQTGAKAWPAYIAYNPKYIGVERASHLLWTVHFGRYDNHPKFQKLNGLSFV